MGNLHEGHDSLPLAREPGDTRRGAYSSIACSSAQRGLDPAIAPFAPGAGTERCVAICSRRLEQALYADRRVDNKTGAGGAIGATEARGCPTRGYTLLFVACRSRRSRLRRSTRATTRAQFVPVAPIAVGPLAIVVGKDAPANTMREFVALAKQMPGKLNYGSAGAGSINHLALELLNARAGIVRRARALPRHRRCDQGPAGRHHPGDDRVDSGARRRSPRTSVQVLAVTGAKRIPQLLDVAELAGGGCAQRQRDQLLGHRRARRHAAADRRRLNAEMKQVLAQPDVRERLEREGAESCRGPPARLGAAASSATSRTGRS